MSPSGSWQTPQSPGADKDISIDSLRGLAALLVVGYHVIGGDATDGLRVADDSGWRFATRALEDIRMPLFTVISGYVYGLRPLRLGGRLQQLALGKARRLLVPLLTAGTVFFLVQAVVPATNSSPRLTDVWRVYVLPYDPYWFLQAIFLVILVVGLLDRGGRLERPRGFLMAGGLGVAAYVAIGIPAEYDVFSVGRALRLFPFFLLGYALVRHVRVRRRSLSVLLPAAVIAYVARLVLVLADVRLPDAVDRLAGLVVGLLVILLLFAIRSRLQNSLLAWIGQFAFAIYVLHIFGTAGTRIVLESVGVSESWVLFPLGVVVAVAAAISFQLTLGRWRSVSWLVLGQRPSPPGPLRLSLRR